MARTIDDIKKSITDKFITNPIITGLYGLVTGRTFEEQFSKVSLESIIFYCVSVGIWSLECLFDLFVKQVDEKIANLKPHTAKWYANKIKAFQYGDVLPVDTDVRPVFDEGKQIVKYCAIVEISGILYVKVAAIANGDLAPLSAAQLQALKAYIDRIRDAGIVYELHSRTADLFKGKLLVHFDPLILDSNGKRIDGSNDTPVLEAVTNYLKNLPFNGEYSNMALIDSIQQVTGVKVVQLQTAQAQYGTNPYTSIESIYIPDAGYMRVSNVEITYTPHEY